MTGNRLDDRNLQAQAIVELLERIGRAAHVRGYSSGLNPAQWAALRFFARTNQSARTPTGFARANGTTLGTATQTVAALERKGYLTRACNPNDRRSVRVALTERGRALLRDDPLNGLTTVIGTIPPDDARIFADELETLFKRYVRPGD